MKVSGLDRNGDWRFGRGRALYIKGSDAVAQKVVTRLRSFKRDWFLDADAGIDWIQILGMRDSRGLIMREVERVITSTDGVLKLISLELKSNRVERTATIYASYQDVYGNELELVENIE